MRGGNALTKLHSVLIVRPRPLAITMTLSMNYLVDPYYDILACWRRKRTKSGKYDPRAHWSLGSLRSARSTYLGTYRLPLGTFRIVTRVPAGRILSTGRALWARPVRQGFCPRPPPAGQYVLYTPLTVYRISGMLYYYNTLEQYFKTIQISGKF